MFSFYSKNIKIIKRSVSCIQNNNLPRNRIILILGIVRHRHMFKLYILISNAITDIRHHEWGAVKTIVPRLQKLDIWSWQLHSLVLLGIEAEMDEKVLQLLGIVRRHGRRLGGRGQQTQQVGRPVAHVRLAPQYRPAAELVRRRRLGSRGRRRRRLHVTPSRGHGRRWRQRWRRRLLQRPATAGRRARDAGGLWTPPAVRHGGLNGRRGRTWRRASGTVVFLPDRASGLSVRLDEHTHKSWIMYVNRRVHYSYILSKYTCTHVMRVPRWRMGLAGNRYTPNRPLLSFIHGAPLPLIETSHSNI